MKQYINWIQEKRKEYPHLLKVTIIASVIIVAFFVTITGGKDQGAISIETRDDNTKSVATTEQSEKANSEESEARQKKTMIIDVGGAVNSPGVIELPVGSRVYQAIEKAGGTTREADLNQINQAIILNDSDKLYIPTLQETQENISSPKSSSSVGYISQNPVSPNASGNNNGNGKVNLNTATQGELETLSGVGPVTASKIIDYREINGKFDQIENIMEVPGIGEKTFESLKAFICI
jgi:competence protein ComEA